MTKTRDDGAVIGFDPPKTTTKRTAVGKLWISLLIRRNAAERENNTDKMGRLADMLSDLEEEFPSSIAAERAYWQSIMESE